MKRTIRAFVLTGVLASGLVLAAGPPIPGGLPPPPPGSPPGVPPDYVPEQGVNPPEKPVEPATAFQACEGRALGERAQFRAKDGRTITGNCVEHKGRLVLKPDLPPSSPTVPSRKKPSPAP